MKKRFVHIAILVIMPFMVFAQNVEFEKANFKNKDGLKEAIFDYEDGDYYYSLSPDNAELALSFYLKAYKFNPSNAILNFKIGLCYLDSKPLSKAFDFFDSAYKLDPLVNPRYNYYYAKAYHKNLQFDKAKELYELYKKNMSSDENNMMLKTVKRNIKECTNGIRMVKNPVNVSIKNVGPAINSEHLDYGPVVNIDESMMFYSARRPESIGGKRSKMDLMYFEDIYWAEKNNGEWQKSKNIGEPINTDYNDGVVGIAPDGNTMILFRDNNGGDLYYSKRHGNEWEKPIAFPKPINSKYLESSASYSASGTRLFFVSDRPGGYGMKDIYYCDIDEKGNYSNPRNLGSRVNTEGDEIGVFAFADGKTIYFSSKEHDGIGDYDVYKATYKNHRWLEPVNLGYPINTPDPEVFFSIGASGRNAYYSSDREGGLGKQDVYRITFLGPKKEPSYSTSEQLIAVNDVIEADVESKVKVDGSLLTLLKGVVTDEVTSKPVEATIELIDNEAGKIIATFQSNSASGKFVISLPSGKNYGFAIYADNYLFYSDNFEIPEFEEYHEVTRNVALQKIIVGSTVDLRNVFFAYNKSNIDSQSKVELDRIISLMKKHKKLKLEVDGHTDNIGSAGFNKKLSLQRAKAVVNYIVAKGISKDRFAYNGYGFSKPKATNATVEGRKLNRRCEIKIIDK